MAKELKVREYRRKGEPLVWLSGGGTALGIVMIAWLVSLVILRGCSTFWPEDIERFTVGKEVETVVRDDQGQIVFEEVNGVKTPKKEKTNYSFLGCEMDSRDLDLRDLPLRTDGTPWTHDNLPNVSPQEILIREGNNAEAPKDVSVAAMDQLNALEISGELENLNFSERESRIASVVGRQLYQAAWSDSNAFRWIKLDLPDADTYREKNPFGYDSVLVKREIVPDAVLIERMAKGPLTGFVRSVRIRQPDGTVDVMATLERDGKDKLWEVFNREHSNARKLFKEGKDIQESERQQSDVRLADLKEELEIIRYEHRDSDSVSMAFANITSLLQQWATLDPTLIPAEELAQINAALRKAGKATRDESVRADASEQELSARLEAWHRLAPLAFDIWRAKHSWVITPDPDNPEKRKKSVAFTDAETATIETTIASLATTIDGASLQLVPIDMARKFFRSALEFSADFDLASKGKTFTGDEERAIADLLETATVSVKERALTYTGIRMREERKRIEAKKYSFVFARDDGAEIEVRFADVVRAFKPNELGFFGKLGVYFDRIWEFYTEEPREANTEGGIYMVIIGTMIMTVLMSIAVVPFGVITALYLREYATQGALVSAVRVSVNNLAGVPSIVFGIFGFGFFCVLVGGQIDDWLYPWRTTTTFGGGGVMWASLTLALLTIPVVVVATEEALASVPAAQREASLGCGASRFQTIWKVILPQSLPGILTGTILAMARGAGEVAPLMLVGVVGYAPDLPLDGTSPFVHLERSFMHLGFHIYAAGFQSPNAEQTKPLVFSAAMTLLVLVGVLNIFAIRFRNHLRKRLASSHV